MTVPGVVEGRIARPGEAHSIRVKIDKAQDIAFEVETPEATLPRFNPVIRLIEPGGREIATDVYTKLNNNGLYMMKMIRAKTTLSLGAPGDYTMQIRDITTAAPVRIFAIACWCGRRFRTSGTSRSVRIMSTCKPAAAVR